MDQSIITNPLKGYFTIFAGIITNLVIGSSLSWTTLMFDFISNFIESNDLYKINPLPYTIPNHNHYYLYLFSSVLISSSNLTNALSPYFTIKLTIKTTLLISFIFLIISHLLLYYSSQCILIIIGVGFFGFGIGLPYQAILRNAWRFFPEYKGLISLVFVFSFCISPCMYIFIWNKIINLNFLKGETLSSQVKIYIWFNMFILLFIGILVCIISFDFYKEYLNDYEHNNNNTIEQSLNITIKEKELKMNSLKPSNSNIISIIDNSKMFNTSNNNNTKESGRISFTLHNSNRTNLYNLTKDDNVLDKHLGNSDFWINIKSAILSKRFFIIVLYYALSLIFSFAIMFNIAYLSKSKDEGDEYQSHNLIINFILSATISRILLTLIINILISYKVMALLSMVLQTILSFTFIKVQEKNKSIFNLYIILIGVCYSINSLVISPLILKIYGNEMAMVISGVVIGIGSLSCWAVFIEDALFREKFDMEGKFLFGGITSLLGIIIYVQIRERKFEYYKGGKRYYKRNAYGKMNMVDYSLLDVRSERNY